MYSTECAHTNLCFSPKALFKLGKTVKQYTMNPKAMPRTQLLGQIDLDTRQWKDGVLTISALQVYGEPPGALGVIKERGKCPEKEKGIMLLLSLMWLFFILTPDVENSFLLIYTYTLFYC